MNGQHRGDQAQLRSEIQLAVESNDAAAAVRHLRHLWTKYPGPLTAGYVVTQFDRLRPQLALKSRRLAILRSFSVEPLVPMLRAAALVQGIDLQVRIGEFNAYSQEILDPSSWLYDADPEIVILAVQTRDLVPALWRDFTDLTLQEVEAAVDQTSAALRDLVHTFRTRSHAHIVVHTLDLPLTPSAGILDAQAQHGQAAAIQRINRDLAELSRTQTGVYLLDYEALVARHGRVSWYDERRWLTVRLPIATDCLTHLVSEWLRLIHPLTGTVCKVLVTDLDNTLWGGVLGEDGLTGIQLGTEYPGAAYCALQRAMLDLYQRGILLAVCSKNNPADATEAIEQHRGMLLRPEHFAAMRIGWDDKASALREIAAELNVGLDSLAFLDDNPIERAWVERQIPEVTIIDLPENPMGYAQALRDSPVFERLSVSVEDRDRGRYYVEQRRRTELQKSVATLEDFYRSLQMEMEIATVEAETIGRVAQLTEKTNQFNVTTRRYTERQIAQMSDDAGWRVYTARLRDRFGDNGLVGVAIVRSHAIAWEIDTLLLSCRVIGRTMETALLATLAEEARADGVERLIGWFLPTRKNAPARDLYRSHGFTEVAQEDGASCWALDLTEGGVAPPPWIARRILIRGAVG